MSTFFYDEQIRRYILQFLRIFSDFYIELPPGDDNVRVQKRVPIVYGDMSRMVAQILKNNDQNTSLTAPMFSGYITDVDMAADRRQDPTNVNPVRAIERKYNNQTGLYESTMGNRYTIERYMPVPINMTMNLDLWTTNTTDKLQILEQIMVIFNPSIQLQTNDNPLDWSAITEVELTGVNWSNRSVPVGTDLSNDFATLTFKVTGWINPPAKVKRQSIIEQIVTSIYNLNIDDINTDVFNPIGGVFDELDRVIVSPGNYRIDVSAIDSTTSRVELLNEYGQSDSTLAWENLFASYGRIDPETTTLTLKTEDSIEETFGDVIGSLEVSDTEQNVATFTVDSDTLPTTIASGPVDNLVNPSINYPGDGTLPLAAVGQRYLLLTNNQTAGEEPLISQEALGPWGSVVAYENDIIEYDGNRWFVSFDASSITTTQYVVNIADAQHYRFENDQWTYTYLATYNPGYWRISSTYQLPPIQTGEIT